MLTYSMRVLQFTYYNSTSCLVYDNTDNKLRMSRTIFWWIGAEKSGLRDDIPEKEQVVDDQWHFFISACELKDMCIASKACWNRPLEAVQELNIVYTVL